MPSRSVFVVDWALYLPCIVLYCNGQTVMKEPVHAVYTKRNRIIISRSELRDRDWSNARQVMCKNIQCCPSSVCSIMFPGNMASREGG